MESEKVNTKDELTTEEKINIYEETLQKCSLGPDTDLRYVPLLNEQEEVDFARRIEQGQEEYREYFLLANLRLVSKKANDYHKRTSRYHSLEEYDLFQEGVMGLMKAVEKFDYTKGYKFSTYATWWIESEISRSVGNKGYMIRYPIPYAEKILLFKKTKNKLFEELEREPNLEEIAKEMGMDFKKAKLLEEGADRTVASIDKPLTIEDDGFSWADILEDNTFAKPEDFVSKKLVSEELGKILDVLNERDREIIKLRYGIGYEQGETLDFVGEKFGLTKERIRQIEDRVLRKIRILLAHKRFESVK